MSNDSIEVGDNVEYNGGTFEVAGAWGRYVWLVLPDAKETAIPGTVAVARVKKVMPFFEPGKTYRRRLPFSIRAQREDVTEYFTPELVRDNSPGRGGRVAFGPVTFQVRRGESVTTQYEIMGEYDWKNNGWVETAE